MKKFLALTIILFVAVSIFAFEKDGIFADFNDQKVYFKSFGKGKKALIFVHGWACNADFWSGNYNAFPEYRVIAVDLIGHKRSDKPKTNYTMEYFAKSIEAVMKKAKVKEAVLVGHSMGTPVIRQFYRLYPKKTLGLVIVDGSLRTGTKEEIEQFILPFRTNYKENSVQFVDGMLEPVQDKKLKQKIRLAMLAVPDYVGLSALEGMIDEKIWTNDQINAPVLAILAKSSWWKADEKDFFKSVAPNIDFQMWEGLSHFLMMEKPKEFNREVKAFIVKNKLL